MRFIKELEAKEGKRKVEDDRERSRIDFQSTDLHNLVKISVSVEPG